MTKRNFYVKRLRVSASSGPEHEAALRRIARALDALEEGLAKEPSERDWVGPSEVAKIVGLSEKTIRRAISRGELRASKVRNRIRIKTHDVEVWLRENPVLVRPGPDWDP